MKYCIFCGASLPDVARFCAKCGNSQDVEEQPASQPAPVQQAAPAPQPAPVQQAAPAPEPASRPVSWPTTRQTPQPAPQPVSQPAPQPVSQPAPQPAPKPAPVTPVRNSSAKGLRYADMTPVVTSMQDKYYKPTGPYTPPPYVKAPEKDTYDHFVLNHTYKDVTTVLNARLTDLPNGSYNSDAMLQVCSDYFRITVSSSLLMMIQWEWVALTFDSIRKISTFTDGRREGATFEFVNKECHPLTVSSKSKHFSELINRVASLAGISITRG